MSKRGKGCYRRRGGRGRRFLPGIAVLLLLTVTAGAAAAGGVFRPDRREVREEASDASESSRAVAPESLPFGPSEETAGEKREPRKFSPEAGPEEILAAMTLEEKILQMFIITPEALTGVDRVYSAGEITREAIDRYPVGGLIYYNGNLISPEQVREMLGNVKQYSRDRIGVPMFTSIDEEGGSQVARISNNSAFDVPKFDDMARIGDTGDAKKAYEVGRGIGGYLSELGFNMDFAPVGDVVTNPENTVVKRRAFGTDGETVAGFVVEEMKGLEEMGVKAVVKHFPGHGATAGDTHEGYAYTDKGLGELLTNELIPFQASIEAGADFIMVSHMGAPSVTGDDTPASLSKALVTELLREGMGFDGVVVTDALNMEVIADTYTSREAAVRAVEAGADLLLMPQNFKEAYEGILEAVKTGEITAGRIDQSVLRILRVKVGLDK